MFYRNSMKIAENTSFKAVLPNNPIKSFFLGVAKRIMLFYVSGMNIIEKKIQDMVNRHIKDVMRLNELKGVPD